MSRHGRDIGQLASSDTGQDYPKKGFWERFRNLEQVLHERNDFRMYRVCYSSVFVRLKSSNYKFKSCALFVFPRI